MSGEPTSSTGGDAPAAILVIGIERLGARIVDLLVEARVPVTAIAAPDDEDDLVAVVREAGARVVVGDASDSGVLADALDGSFRAAIVAADDDVANLHVALALRDAAPGLRIVLRMFNSRLADQVVALLEDVEVLSATRMVAPAFAQIALGDSTPWPVDVGSSRVVVSRDASAGVSLGGLVGADGAALTVRAEARPPQGSEAFDRVGEWRLRGAWPLLAALVADRRFRWFCALLALMVIAGAALQHRLSGAGLVESLLHSVTVVASVDIASLPTAGEPWGIQIAAAMFAVLDALLIALLFTLITDVVVGERITNAAGGSARRLREHVVVCGLGTAGMRVVETLVALDVPVAAIDVSAEGRFMPSARRLGVPVLVGDVRQPEALEWLNISRARALVACTNDDAANLEVALAARSLAPDARLVLRLFDDGLAARVAAMPGVDGCRSVAALAAPSFVLAAFGSAAAVFHVGGDVIVAAESTRVDVPDGVIVVEGAHGRRVLLGRAADALDIVGVG